MATKRYSFIENYMKRKSSSSKTSLNHQYINEQPYKSQKIEPTRSTERKDDVNRYQRPSVVSMSSQIDLMEKPAQSLNQTIDNTKRNKIIALIVAIVIALLLAGLITFCVLYFVMLRNPGYKEACDTLRPCISGKNLTCNGTCICNPSTTYWDGSNCVPLVSFGSVCLGGSFQCMESLICKNKVCQCDNITFYNGTKCAPKNGYGVSCNLCNMSLLCPTCDSCFQCKDYEDLFCNTTNSKCYCNHTTHYYDPLLGCVLKVGFNRYCTNNDMCQDVTNNLYCKLTTTSNGTYCPYQPQNNFCNCPSNMYYNGSTCVPFEDYYGPCPSRCECDNTTGLYCDTIDLKCNCLRDYYWNGTYCVPQQSFNSSCTTSNQCLGSKGLTCVGGLCKCNLYVGNGYWYWSTYLEECLQCPSDWRIFSYGNEQRCIKKSTDVQTWYNAELNCELNGARLAQINDTLFGNALRSSGYIATYNYWVGATDQQIEGTFKWIFDGDLVGNSVFPIVLSGGTVENCLLISPPSWSFIDGGCSGVTVYLCQKIY